jgi:hypothetical protein
VVTPVPSATTETVRLVNCSFQELTASDRLSVMRLALQHCVENPAAFERCIENIATADRLERLQVWGVDPSSSRHQEALRNLLKALGKNRGLICLAMRLFLLNHELWRLLWEAVAIHPTLRVVDVEESPTYFATSYEREYRDSCIIRALVTNHVLTDIVHTLYDHDFGMMHTSILPALEFNRFRTRVKAIEQVQESHLRLFLTALALAHPSARQFADIRRFVALSLCSRS